MKKGQSKTEVAIIGGGAAGFFAAIQVKENYPNAEVVIFEKTTKLLSKVKVSGGGRCNVTNGETNIKKLSQAYPRGSTKLKKAFHIFNTRDTMEWFESRGVSLMTQEDNCVFPVSQDSQTIIDCFLRETKRLKIRVEMKAGIDEIIPEGDKIKLVIKQGGRERTFDKVIVATGGAPRKEGLEWLKKLGHEIVRPVPSLFTFKIPKNPIIQLMGVVVETAITNIQGTKLKGDGPLLITHWGMSGPAILKLSAYGARVLSEKNYVCNLQVNWIGISNFDAVCQALTQIKQEHPNKQLGNFRPYLLPERLWHFFLEKVNLPKGKKWNELGKKSMHQLIEVLTNDIYEVRGQTKFKEEFVTAGGISLESVNFKTMESRIVPNLYFAGEVLDVDGITGGYNFQAAWTTGFIAGQLR